jgi:hypothetical protein
MAVTTLLESIPNVYQRYYDSTIPAIVSQYWNGTSWVTSRQESLANGLMTATDGVKVPYSVGTLASDYTSVSTTYVATGLTATITPTDTAVEVIGSINVQNSTANDGVGIALYRTVAGGSAPAAGSAAGGSDTKVWEANTTHAVAAQNLGAGLDFVDTGLTAGSQYVYYYVIKAITGGTAKQTGNATLANSNTVMLQNI